MKDSTQTNNVQSGANLVAYYTIEGVPISLKRPRFGLGHVYDSQKKEKFGVQIQLKSQHEFSSPFEGPLQLEVTFFMPMPQRLHRKYFAGSFPPHHARPDLDNLLKWLLDNLNEVIIKDDSQIYAITARKVYSEISRTEFSITRLES